MEDAAAIEVHPVANRDEVFVTWNVAWPIERYVAWYLENRKHPVDAEWTGAVREMMKSFPGVGALRKSDVDFFLDTHAPKWAPVWTTRIFGTPPPP